MPSNLNDNEIWIPEEQYKYLADCAHANNLSTAKALSDAAGVDPSFTSRFKTGSLKNPTLIPVVRLFMAANASLDVAFNIKDFDSEEFAEMKAQLLILQAENEAQKSKIAQYELENAEKEKLLDERKASIEYEREMSRRKSRHIFVVTALLIFLVLVVAGICLYDRFNPDIGWFRELYNKYNDASTNLHIINSLKG